jgi:hypothetical protein
MNEIIMVLTRIIIKISPRYNGWCGAAYHFYRMRGQGPLKAYLGAFTIE